MEAAARPDLVRLDDLAEPRFTPEVEEIRGPWRAMAADCPLDADVLHRQATAETGPRRLRRPGLPGAPRRAPRRGPRHLRAHRAGIVNFHMQIAPAAQEPAAAGRPARPAPGDPRRRARCRRSSSPACRAPAPRTCTTCSRPAGRSARSRYWESVEPFPLPAEVGLEPDPRIGAHRPGRVVHEPGDAAVPADARDDDRPRPRGDPAARHRLLHACCFETLGHVPAWRDHYLAHDQTPHYRAPAAPAPGAAAPARRPPVAAQVAAAPRAAPGARPRSSPG